MATKKKMQHSCGQTGALRQASRGHPKIERKGAANPYTSLNGHMFTYLNPSGTMVLRLPEKEREEFLKKLRRSFLKRTAPS
jgi:hypothetical protein